MSHYSSLLLAAPEVTQGLPKPTFLGTVIGVVVCAGIVWWCVHKKGAQWPWVALGVFLAVVLASVVPHIFFTLSTSWASLFTGLSNAVMSTISAFGS